MRDLFDEKNISPMLLNEVKEPFDDDDYIYELKLDGIRCVAYIEPKSVTLQNKRFKDLTDIYPFWGNTAGNTPLQTFLCAGIVEDRTAARRGRGMERKRLYGAV